MLQMCPNIHELHLMKIFTEQETVRFFSDVKLQQLTLLNIDHIELSGTVPPSVRLISSYHNIKIVLLLIVVNML